MCVQPGAKEDTREADVLWRTDLCQQIARASPLSDMPAEIIHNLLDHVSYCQIECIPEASAKITQRCSAAGIVASGVSTLLPEPSLVLPVILSLSHFPMGLSQHGGPLCGWF